MDTLSDCAKIISRQDSSALPKRVGIERGQDTLLEAHRDLDSTDTIYTSIARARV